MVGTIESSDTNRLYLAVVEGERHWIERSDVTDIEHPGVIGTIGGAILTTLGVGFLAWAPFLRNDCPYDCMASNRGLAIVAGAATLLSGVPVMISNLKRYRRSRAAAEPPR